MATNIKLQLNPIEQLCAARNLNDKGQRMLASEVKRLCDPYAPMLSGIMKDTAQVLSDGVLYPQPYSQKQYYLNGGGKDGKRGKHWDKRMMADKKGVLLDTMAKITGGKKA